MRPKEAVIAAAVEAAVVVVVVTTTTTIARSGRSDVAVSLEVCILVGDGDCRRLTPSRFFPSIQWCSYPTSLNNTQSPPPSSRAPIHDP